VDPYVLQVLEVLFQVVLLKDQEVAVLHLD